MWGSYEYKAALRGNSVIGNYQGPNIIEFKNGDRITFELPPCKVSGLIYGKRIIEWQEAMVFHDKKNKITGNIKFDESGSLFSKRQHPSDYFEFQ